jgi:hypothetical protein
MLHWTILNEEEVFNTLNNDAKPKQYKELVYGDAILVVEVLPDGRGKVERLISPRPMDYLNRKWQPGEIVNLYEAVIGEE